MKTRYDRRTILRGMVGGATIGVALPLLDCFLNDSGTAFAAGGGPLPLRFGTWFWGCGVNPDRWVPAAAGRDFELTPEMQALAPVRQHLSVLTGFNVATDGRPNFPHITGVLSTLTGTACKVSDQVEAPTVDVLISDAVGAGSRFRSLDISAVGDPKVSYSRRSASASNPPEISPVALYTRVFGPDFRDPNAADFRPDPRVLLRRSVLSVVSEDRRRLLREVGSGDRTRLDDYFTALRQTEQQLEMQLRPPPPAEACSIPGKPAEAPVGTEIEDATANHRIMAQLLAMALACNQTRVFNVVFSRGGSDLRKAGGSTSHHQLTHEEPVDPKLGYQPQSTYFSQRSVQAWAEFVSILARVREGDGSLLDNCAILAHSDVSLAKVHDLTGLPVMIAGRAGGRLRPGLHVRGNGDPVTRVGLTLQQVMGVPVERWGTGSLQTSKPVGEILA